MVSKRYVVLGGGGAFGIQTAFYLLHNAAHDGVWGIGRNPLRSEAFSLNIDKEPGYTYKPFHVTYELDLLMEYLDVIKPQVIINYAAQGEGAVSWKHSWRYFETNSMGLTRLVEQLMTRDWLERFIQIGTSEMYGSVTAPAPESAPIKPSSPYAASKVAFDLYLLSIYEQTKFPFVILRPSNCYCAGQLLHRIVPRTVLCGLTGQKLPLHGGGKAQKSYLDVDDLAHAIHLVSRASNDEVNGRVFNVGPDEPIRIRDLVMTTAVVMNLSYQALVEEAPERPGQDACYWLDSSAIQAATGWRPIIDLPTGLDHVVEWATRYLPYLRTVSPEYVFRG